MANIKISGAPYPFALQIGTPNGTEVFAADQTVGGKLQTVSLTVAKLFGGLQVAGWGVPTGAAVVTNFPGGGPATLAQCSTAIAKIITDLKTFGMYGA